MKTHKTQRILFGFVIFIMAAGITKAQPADSLNVSLLKETTIFPEETFAACHASTIIETAPDEFLAAWFAGSYEGANDVGIWTSELKYGKWSTPVQAAKGVDSSGDETACWNPVLFKTKDNIIYLFYKVGKNPREWWGMVIQSSDNGKSWSEPRQLPDGFLGPIKNKPIQLSNGNIICPSSIESTGTNIWSVHIEITNEDLSSWKRINVEADSGVGVIQPTLLLHPDGKLQMLCRSRQNVIYQSWSSGNGLHWSKLEKTSLPNPNSGIDGVRLDNGSFVLVYNPLLQGSDWFIGRNVLNATFSKDGENWKDICQLENEKEGEFSYPAVIQASNKSIHITYTANRKNIKYVVLKINDI